MNYRADIDGLRALAVIPVILFHAQFEWFKGGYVGVDIFFVISGFLITSILLKETEQGGFRVLKFYERRARRMLPALSVVVLATVAAAFFLLFPKDFDEFSQSLIGVATFTSNVYFWRDSGYFSTAADLKPLLHTWSLAVEEQYYILFPLLALLLSKFGSRALVLVVAAIFVSSLLLAEWGIHNKPVAAFFLLPTRAWEIALGALCALSSRWPLLPRSGMSSQLLSGLGLVLSLFAVFAFDTETPVPGLMGLIPTLGAALIILFSTERTWAGRILSMRPLVFIGLLSYSAYLWHQPILALARHATSLYLSDTVRLAALVLTAALSYASWRFVEKPARRADLLSRARVWGLSSAVLAAMLIVGVVGVQTQGMAWRFSLPPAPQAWASIKCHGAVEMKKYPDPLAFCLGTGPNRQGGDFYLIGDSHAAQFTFPLQKAAEAMGREFSFMNTEQKSDFPLGFLFNDTATEDTVLEHILKVSDPGDMVLVAFHQGRLNDITNRHLEIGETVAENLPEKRFYRNFTSQVGRLKEAGLTVVLIKDSPLVGDQFNIETCMSRFLNRGASGCSVSREQDLWTRTRQTRLFDRLAADNPSFVHVLDPLPLFYEGGDDYDPISPEGEYRMFDVHHLTEAESLRSYEFFKEELEKLSEES